MVSCTVDSYFTILSNYNAFNDGKCIIGVFIDFSKAFDTIDHEILLEKLKLFNFNKSAINWIKSFLSSRTQQTQIESVLSQPKIISCGVPQGSILGPTLFLIYINDLCNVLTTLTPILYADDTSLFVESRDLNSLTSSINIDLKNLFNWCLHNKLTINLKKTAYIILKNPQNKYQFANNSIFIDKTAIDQVFTIKFLGVFIDTHLNWLHHISKLIESMRPIAGLFLGYQIIFQEKFQLFCTTHWFIQKSVIALILGAMHRKLILQFKKDLHRSSCFFLGCPINDYIICIILAPM